MNTDNIAERTAWAYVRLSRREEIEGQESMAEKFAIRSGICKRIAEEHNLILPDEHIIVEQKSAGYLHSRPGMVRLLEMAKQKRLPNLITPYVDRLLRGNKRDEQDIEDGLVIGSVKLYTTEQPHPIIFDADYDPTLFEIKSFIARSELRGTIRKRRMADAEKLDRGIRVCGPAPYGYTYLRATYDAMGKKVAPQRHEVVPEEWPIVCEIFRRVWDESLRSICIDLNRRGIQAPATGRRIDAAGIWRHGTLRTIVLNPFYAGYLSAKGRMVRGKRIAATCDNYKLSSTKGDWPIPHEIEDWQRLVALFSGRAPSYNGDPKSVSGVLFNFCGHPMARRGKCWGCNCVDSEYRVKGGSASHLGGAITDYKVLSFVGEVVAAVVAALPANALARAAKLKSKAGPSIEEQRKVQAVRLVQVNRDLAEENLNIEDMIVRKRSYLLRFTEEQYDSAVQNTQERIKSFVREAAAIQDALSEIAAPDPSTVLPTLMKIRARSMTAEEFALHWRGETEEVRRILTHAIIRRIDLQTPADLINPKSGKTWIPGATVTLWAWVDALMPKGFELPAMRAHYKRPFDWHEARATAKARREEESRMENDVETAD